jgi:hypothetical protein
MLEIKWPRLDEVQLDIQGSHVVLIYVVVSIIVLPFILYYGGLFVSTGWHKAKRNHLREVINDLEKDSSIKDEK